MILICLIKIYLALLKPFQPMTSAHYRLQLFTRFFEWLREISDIENAQAAYLVQRIRSKQSDQQDQTELLNELQKELSGQPKQLTSPNLYALKNALNIVLPELTDLYLQYQPRLQLMVDYEDQTLPFQQLSNTTKTWIALVGDIARRLCLLNPLSLNPCLEGRWRFTH